MASYNRREVTTKRVEFALSSPTNWAEVGKVVGAIRVEIGEDRAQWDDAVTVSVQDDEIVFSYEVKEATRG